MKSTLQFLILLFLSFSLFTSCGSFHPFSSESKPSSNLASKVIGPNGGIITSPDGQLKLAIPAGALDSTETISIAVIHSGDIGPEFEDIQSDFGFEKIYEFGPDGLQFDKPVTVNVKSTQKAEQKDGSYRLHPEFLFTSSKGNPEALENQGIILNSNSEVFVYGELSHFSPLVDTRLQATNISATISNTEFEEIPSGRSFQSVMSVINQSPNVVENTTFSESHRGPVALIGNDNLENSGISNGSGFIQNYDYHFTDQGQADITNAVQIDFTALSNLSSLKLINSPYSMVFQRSYYNYSSNDNNKTNYHIDITGFDGKRSADIPGMYNFDLDWSILMDTLSVSDQTYTGQIQDLHIPDSFTLKFDWGNGKTNFFEAIKENNRWSLDMTGVYSFDTPTLTQNGTSFNLRFGKYYQQPGNFQSSVDIWSNESTSGIINDITTSGNNEFGNLFGYYNNDSWKQSRVENFIAHDQAQIPVYLPRNTLTVRILGTGTGNVVGRLLNSYDIVYGYDTFEDIKREQGNTGRDASVWTNSNEIDLESLNNLASEQAKMIINTDSFFEGTFHQGTDFEFGVVPGLNSYFVGGKNCNSTYDSICRTTLDRDKTVAFTFNRQEDRENPDEPITGLGGPIVRDKLWFFSAKRLSAGVDLGVGFRPSLIDNVSDQDYLTNSKVDNVTPMFGLYGEFDAFNNLKIPGTDIHNLSLSAGLSFKYSKYNFHQQFYGMNLPEMVHGSVNVSSLGLYVKPWFRVLTKQDLNLIGNDRSPLYFDPFFIFGFNTIFNCAKLNSRYNDSDPVDENRHHTGINFLGGLGVRVGIGNAYELGVHVDYNSGGADTYIESGLTLGKRF